MNSKDIEKKPDCLYSYPMLISVGLGILEGERNKKYTSCQFISYSYTHYHFIRTLGRRTVTDCHLSIYHLTSTCPLSGMSVSDTVSLLFKLFGQQ